MADNNKSVNPNRAQYDPGWNDPPMMQFNPSSLNANKTKLNLNKRIAFPLTNTVKPTAIVQPNQAGLPLTAIPTQPSQLPVAIVNPMPHSQNHPPSPLTNSVPNFMSNVMPNENEFSNENEVRDFCLNTFQTHLGNVIETIHIRTDEIQRRLNILSQMWLNKELDTSIHEKLLCIAKALQSSNFNEAIENHRILVVSHSNMCMQWATALRQIILTIKIEDIGADMPSTSNNFSIAGNILVPSFSDNSTSQSDPAFNVQHIRDFIFGKKNVSI